MTQVVGEHQPAIIVTDASVLINFLHIDRTDLLAGHSHAFLATDHVAAEITDCYPDQQQRFAAALAAGAISETRVTSPEEIRLFGSMFATGRLGAGECSGIALAVHRRYVLAIDDRLATTHARRADATLRILATQDLVVSMINQGLLNIAEADRIKQEWAHVTDFGSNWAASETCWSNSQCRQASKRTPRSGFLPPDVGKPTVRKPSPHTPTLETGPFLTEALATKKIGPRNAANQSQQTRLQAMCLVCQFL